MQLPLTVQHMFCAQFVSLQLFLESVRYVRS